MIEVDLLSLYSYMFLYILNFIIMYHFIFITPSLHQMLMLLHYPISNTAGHCEGQAKNNASPTFSMENGSLGCPESGEVCHKFRLKQN